jgi:acyl CoA:acetate/3-ketoacid CoA transferase beta subunit
VITRDEYCVIACAEAWRGDGAILASSFGFIPTIGARLARATFSPELLISDGEALLVSNDMELIPREKEIEGWMPFRHVFDIVWSGRRHVMMGATQIDRFGNQNISCIGDHAKPTKQLIGVRGAPGNTINSARTFVEKVDMISGAGWNNGAREIRRIVTNLCVFDFETVDHSMRLRSIHPGVTVDDVRASTGFDIDASDVKETRAPTGEELRLIREVFDPTDLRKREVPA